MLICICSINQIMHPIFNVSFQSLLRLSKMVKRNLYRLQRIYSCSTSTCVSKVIPAPGYHFADACAGAATVYPLQSVEISLDHFRKPQQRLERYVENGVHYLIDTANANEHSIINAIETLAMMETDRKKNVVLAGVYGLETETQTVLSRI